MIWCKKCGGLCWSWKESKLDKVATPPLVDVSVAATRVVALEVYAASAQDSLSQISWLKNFNSGNNRSTRNTGLVQLNNCAITKHIYMSERSPGTFTIMWNICFVFLLICKNGHGMLFSVSVSLPMDSLVVANVLPDKKKGVV